MIYLLCYNTFQDLKVCACAFEPVPYRLLSGSGAGFFICLKIVTDECEVIIVDRKNADRRRPYKPKAFPLSGVWKAYGIVAASNYPGEGFAGQV